MKRKIVKVAFGLVGLALIAGLMVVGFYGVRQVRAAAAAEAKWQSTEIHPLEDFGATRRLEILPLYEEAGDTSQYQIGHGLAYLVRTDEMTILVDVGNNPTETEVAPLVQNMQALGVSWDEVDAVFLTHFHPDHVGGVEAWRAGRGSLGKTDVDLQGKPVFAASMFEFPGAAPVLLTEPYVIAPGVATLGAIDYAEGYPVSLFQAAGSEQVLAVNVAGEGIVLIMGCGHPTVERIFAKAEALFEQPIIGMVGGVHFEGMSAEEAGVHIEVLTWKNLKLAAPSPHDSSPEALQAFREAFGARFVDIMVGAPLVLGK